MILVGAVWLAWSVGWITGAWWEVVLPALLIVWGLTVLLGSGSPSGERDPGLPRGAGRS